MPNVCSVDSVPSGGENDSQPLPIGGHLHHFYSQWEASTTDAWTLQTIRMGLTLEFTSRPPSRFIQCLLPSNLSKQALMEAEIQHLLQIQAIEPVPPEHQGTSFYSIFFLLPKSSGGHRGILYLKQLNQFVTYHKFRMESLHSHQHSPPTVPCPVSLPSDRRDQRSGFALAKSSSL